MKPIRVTPPTALPVTVDEVQGGRAACHLPGGQTLTCDASAGVARGARVHLSLRPERVIVAAQPGVESLKATVRENIFVGTDITTIVDLAGGEEFRIRTSNSDRGRARIFEPGAGVFLNMEQGAARLLTD